MSIKSLLMKLNLRYHDNEEEKEYNEVKLPLINGFFKTLFIALTAILIPYAVRYFQNNIFPQNFIIIALIILAFVVFCLKHKFTKYLEPLLFGYIVVIVALFSTVFREVLPSKEPREAFYMGYAFAMIHRLVGYRVLQSKYMALLYICSIAIKFPMIPNPDAILNVIIIALDILTVGLNFKSEMTERVMYDVSFRAKKAVVKFKDLLTKYLPNQMAIFANDYSETYYMNHAFEKSFKCNDKHKVRDSLEKYIVEKDTLEKNATLFASIGFLHEGEQTFTLSRFMSCLAKNISVLRDTGLISFPVIEEEKVDQVPLVEDAKDGAQDQKDALSIKNTLEISKLKRSSQETPLAINKSEGVKQNSRVAIDANESLRSSDRGASKSNSSDFSIEEGRRRVYKVKIFPLLWDDTEAIAMVLDDITKQKIIMELKLADKNKDLVIAMVSHELRTPLNGMLGLLDIARKHIEQADAISYLNACKNSGVLMLNLVNSILDMNQIKNKKLRLVFVKVSVKDLLCEIRSLFDYFCLLKNLYLKIEIGPRVPKWITTDKNRLSQILVNLLGNAFKFTFNGGITVRVTMESVNPYRVRFSVEDTGIGIKKQDQTRLFKMYGKLEQEDKNINSNGIGLGLTISNTLAMLLNPLENRSIEVESEVGKGTSFSFIVQSQSTETGIEEFSLADISSLILNEDRDTTILKRMSLYTINNKDNFTKMVISSQNLDSKHFLSPQAENKPLISRTSQQDIVVEIPNVESSSLINKLKPVIALRKRESSKNRDSKYREIEEEAEQEDLRPWCLVVDDNPFNLMVACHIMEEKNYRVKTGLNGLEAIQKIKEHKEEGHAFNVILMDCQMPVMDGYEATKVLRGMMKAGEIKECPIVALTANNRDDEHDKLCEEVGMSGHVSKPLQIDELEAVLRDVQKVRD